MYQSTKEIAEELKLSMDTVRDMFINEPGVLVIESKPSRFKRRYRTLRIPLAVKERVLTALTKK